MRTPPGPALWPDCGGRTAYKRHNDTGQPTCSRCRAAARNGSADYRKRRYLGGPRRVSTVGTHRRIHALHAIGWTAQDIASRLNPPVSASAVQMTLQRAVIYRDRAAAYAAVYDQLWETPGPSVKTRARAAANGWLPPMCLDDDRLEDPDYEPKDWRSVA